MARVLWPERESLYDLMLRRVSVGSAAFASEKQNDPVDPTACEWPDEYFTWPALWFDKWPEKLALKAMALDPSKGKDSKHGDYSAFVVMGYDVQGVLWVEADLARRPTPQIVEDGFALAKKHQPDLWVIEAEQFQELLCVDIQRRNVIERLNCDIMGILTGGVNKQVRIRRLSPYLSQHRIRFKSHSPGTAMLVQQLRDFPQADHDDGPDAAEQALRALIERWNGRQAQRPQRVLV